MKITRIHQLSAAATIFAFAAITVFAQSPGSLDTTFGTGGGVATTYVATTQNNLSPGKGAIQADGKILQLVDAHLNIGNSFTNVVIRYNTDGTLDSNFGSGGFLYMNWNGANNAFGNAYAMTTQTVGSSEKIIVAGSGGGGSGTLRVDRYDPDGSVDVSFGVNGSALLNAGYALAVAVQPDGKILTMGDVSALVRLTANGTPDTTFGSGGVVQNSAVKCSSLAVQSNGRILAFGNSTVGGKLALTVARFNANGSLYDGGRKDLTPGDSFGTGGKTTISFFTGGSSGSNYRSDGMKIDGSGKIVVGGTAGPKNSSNFDFAVARMTANGQLDGTFGSGGKVTIDFTGFSDEVRSVELASDGKVVLTGVMNTSLSASGQNLAIVRLTQNGSFDATFGQGGKVISSFSDLSEPSYDGLLQIDPICACEKIVVVGTAQIDGIDYGFAARYLL